MTQKNAPTEQPVHPLIQARWSPRGFQDKDVPRQDLLSVLEAARWAASCYNAQPWRLVVASRDQEPEAYEALMSGLNEFNQGWARSAPVIVVVAANPTFSFNGQPNRHSWYDTGAAVAQLTLEATHRGLHVHQMGGIDPDALRQASKLPEELEIICALVLGYAGTPEGLPEGLQEQEKAPRQRAPFSDTITFGAYQG